MNSESEAFREFNFELLGPSPVKISEVAHKNTSISNVTNSIQSRITTWFSTVIKSISQKVGLGSSEVQKN